MSVWLKAATLQQIGTSSEMKVLKEKIKQWRLIHTRHTTPNDIRAHVQIVSILQLPSCTILKRILENFPTYIEIRKWDTRKFVLTLYLDVESWPQIKHLQFTQYGNKYILHLKTRTNQIEILTWTQNNCYQSSFFQQDPLQMEK